MLCPRMKTNGLNLSRDVIKVMAVHQGKENPLPWASINSTWYISNGPRNFPLITSIVYNKEFWIDKLLVSYSKLLLNSLFFHAWKYIMLKEGYPIIFASNVIHNSHLIQKCIQNQRLLLILYTLLNQMRVVKKFDTKMIGWTHFRCILLKWVLTRKETNSHIFKMRIFSKFFGDIVITWLGKIYLKEQKNLNLVLEKTEKK